MHAFSVPPFDQTLYVNGVILEPDDATLADLQIEAESIVNVKVDSIITDDPLQALIATGTKNKNKVLNEDSLLFERIFFIFRNS